MAPMFRRKETPPPVEAGEAKKLAFGTRTPEEIAESLRAAATARAEKKAVLDRVRAGEITLADMFSQAYEHDERVQRLLVGSALRALPNISQYKASKILAEAGITKGRRIQGLGSRQRAKLLDLAK